MSLFRHVIYALAMATSTTWSMAAQESKPVLVLFPGVGESNDDFAGFASRYAESDTYSKLLVARCNWRTEAVPIMASRVFRSLDARYPDGKFILFGFDEGGMVAEWIAQRVRAADGRVVRVITANTPFDGEASSSSEPAGTPSLTQLSPDSATIRDLKSTPLNDLRTVEFIRLWEKGQTRVSQQSAFRRPSQSGVRVFQLVVRTKAYDAHDDLPKLLSQARAHSAANEFDKAIGLLKDALNTAPNDPDVNLLLGQSCFSLGLHAKDAPKARAMFQEATLHFDKAIRFGRSVSLPVRHQRSSVIQLDRRFCRSTVTLDKQQVQFTSWCDEGDGFSTAPRNVTDVQFDSASGQLHFAVPMASRKGSKLRPYNLFPPNTNSAVGALRGKHHSFSYAEGMVPPGGEAAMLVVYNLLLTVVAQ